MRILSAYNSGEQGGDSSWLIPYLYVGGSRWVHRKIGFVSENGKRGQAQTSWEHFWDTGIGLKIVPTTVSLDLRIGLRNAPWEDNSHVYAALIGGLLSYTGSYEYRYHTVDKLPRLHGILGIQSISKEQAIQAGEEANISIILENKGNEPASDISLNMNLSDYKEYLDIGKLESIQKLKQGEQQVIHVPIKADWKIPTGTIRIILVGTDKKGYRVSTEPLEIQTLSVRDATGIPLTNPKLATIVSFSDRATFIPNQVLDAGERGEMTVTVRNDGEGVGFDVKLSIKSDNPNVVVAIAKQLGDIFPNDEKTVTIPLQTSLQAKDGFANILVETKEKRGFDAQKQKIQIPVVHLSAPKLDITSVELNDRKLGRAQGNGNGISENDETIELIAFISNKTVSARWMYICSRHFLVTLSILFTIFVTCIVGAGKWR